MATTKIHRFTADLDRCICNGEWVWFDGKGTHGCDVAGPYRARPSNMDGAKLDRLPTELAFALDERGRTHCAICRGTVNLEPCDGFGALCERCSMECACGYHDNGLDPSAFGEDEEFDDDYTEYCEHGTYVGSPHGPDYLCGRCEMA